ncbi:MAG: cell division protein FtsZ [Chloroflexota bacterium]|nr:cell division protein FtsZ [Chloroflexota bacterium]
MTTDARQQVTKAQESSPQLFPKFEMAERPYGTAVIRVVGVGGGGCNAVNRMFKEKVPGVEYYAMNTDSQHLYRMEVANRLAIGQKMTRGLGAGGDPEKGRLAAEENREQLLQLFQGTDMVFITAGMGGGTGTGAAPVVAACAREAGALVVAVVTKPFSFEVAQRRKNAEAGLAAIRDHVDTLIVIPNDRLLTIGRERQNYTWDEAMHMADSVLEQGVQAIAQIITVPGEINVDFADIKAIMGGAGAAWLAIGKGKGETRAVDAARMATKSPLLDIAIEGAKRILFVVSGGTNMTLQEVQEAADVVQELADPEANVIFGTTRDPKLEDELKLTLVAAGFPMVQDNIAERETELKRLLRDSVPSDSEDLDIPSFLRKQAVQKKYKPSFLK